jgi:phosphoglucosamine mutase
MSKERSYFGTDGIRGKVGLDPITSDFMVKLGWAVGSTLHSDGHQQVLLGRDTRASGEMLEAALTTGFMMAGVDVVKAGVIPTPAVAYLTRTLQMNAGIMVSASHNPAEDNGVKFFSQQGMKFPDEIEIAIEKALQKPIVTNKARIGKLSSLSDATERYIEFCKTVFSEGQNLKGRKIVVDAAHGAGSDIAPTLLRALGADVICIGCTPNGQNINQGCGATSLEQLQRVVLSEGAELGLALDGDGDRLMMVDHQGVVVDGDELLFILAKDAEAEGLLKGGVVGTSMSNGGLIQALSERHITFLPTKVGDRFVLEALLKNGWQLGGESSGHIICLDKVTTGDALIAALKILEIMVRTEVSLYDLKQGMVKWPQVLTSVRSQNASQLVLQESVQEYLKQLEHVLGQEGRILLRPSGTEPLIRVMVEAADRKQAEWIAKQLVDFILEVQL